MKTVSKEELASMVNGDEVRAVNVLGREGYGSLHARRPVSVSRERTRTRRL